MLQQVLEHIHNMFIKNPNPGTYTIANGVISPDINLKDGQRIWIIGSDLNDGVYTFHQYGIRNDDDTMAAGLHDETFAGTICALAVPPAVIALSGEINEWVEKYGENVNSPYQSENVIGVYSYTKATVGAARKGAGDTIGWQDVFRDRLNRWRKVSL